MRITFKLVLFFSIFSSCQESKLNGIHTEPVYFDYQNSWEEKNLFGKVKSISERKVTFKVNKEIDEKNLQSKIWFTDFGALQRLEYFGTFGDTAQIEEYRYDENKNLIENNTKLVGANRNFKTLIINDSINNTKIQKAYLNDSLFETNVIYYDENDRIKKHLEIKNNDTIEYSHKFKFDKEGNLLSEIQIDKRRKEKLIENHYKYNKKGKVILIIYKVHSTEYISKFDWKDNKIISRSDFIVYPDESSHLEESYEYDELFNPINYKKFIDSKIDQETQYEYEFDEKGNWTKRTVFLKQNYLGSNEFEKAYVEIREIEYW